MPYGLGFGSHGNIFPMLCPVQLRVLRPGTFQTVAGKGDKPGDQLMLKSTVFYQAYIQLKQLFTVDTTALILAS